MSEGKKISKKLVIILSICFGLAIVAEFYLLFSLKDWSQHRFEALGYIIKILLLAYAIYIVIKRRDKGEDVNEEEY